MPVLGNSCSLKVPSNDIISLSTRLSYCLLHSLSPFPPFPLSSPPPSPSPSPLSPSLPSSPLPFPPLLSPSPISPSPPLPLPFPLFSPSLSSPLPLPSPLPPRSTSAVEYPWTTPLRPARRVPVPFRSSSPSSAGCWGTQSTRAWHEGAPGRYGREDTSTQGLLVGRRGERKGGKS